MTLDEWLRGPIYREHPLPTVEERLAELIYKNGGRLKVTGYGFTSFQGPYGHTGLLQEEAFELMELGGTLVGFFLAEGKDMHYVIPRLERIVNEQTTRITIPPGRSGPDGSPGGIQQDDVSTTVRSGDRNKE